MRLYFEQIPEGVDISEYPEETEFVLDDSRPKRDLETGRLIPRARRPLVYPHEITARKQPVRIQFLDKPILQERFCDEITIDYRLREVRFTRVDSQEHCAAVKKCSLSEDKFSELLEITSVTALLDWAQRDLRHEESAGYRDGWSIACYVTVEECGESYVSQLACRYRNSPYEKLLYWTEQFAPKEFEDFYHGCICPI